MYQYLKHSKFGPLVVFVILFTFTQLMAINIYFTEKNRELQMVQHESAHLKKRIEAALSQSNNATSILALLIEHDLLNNHFDEVAKELLKHNEYIDAIQLVQDMVIVKTFPLKGNEQTIGYNLKLDNEHVREIMLSSSLSGLHFEGPFTLRQGGVGFVGRYPIIQHDTLWGFSAVVIKKDKFIHLLGLKNDGTSDAFWYQVKKQQGGKKYIPLFSEQRTDFTKGILDEQYLPIGDWIIQVKLKDPVYIARSLWFALAGLAVSVIFSLLMLCKHKPMNQ
jgi:sensor domain CHASE-containing protein